jgi:phage tail tape-measure protein
MISRKGKAGTSIASGLSGAGTGAQFGSAFGPIGTVIGVGVGAAGGALLSGKTQERHNKDIDRAKELSKKVKSGKKPLSFKDQKEYEKLQKQGLISKSSSVNEAVPESSGGSNIKTFNKYTQEQQQAMNTLLQKAISGLENPNYAQERFAPIAQAARQKFAEEELPSIAQRFASMGGLGSTGFAQSATAAQAGLNRDLASLGAQYEQSYEAGLRDLANIGLKEQFDTLYSPGSGNFQERLLEDLLRNSLTGENIKGGALSLKDALQQLLSGRKNSGALEKVGAGEPFKYTPQLINPGTNKINSRNAMQAVVGAGAPNYFSPQTNSLQVNAPVVPPTSGLSAAKLLYNI